MIYRISNYIFFIICISCSFSEKDNNIDLREFTDDAGRKVLIADTIKKIIPLNESTIKMICYMECNDFIAGIEDVERRGVAFSHIFANPDILDKPVIGPLGGGDNELIISQNPDLIIISGISAIEADELQKKLRTPVFVINYGDLSDNKEIFYNCLKTIGNIFHKEDRAQELISFIESEIADIKQRVKDKNSYEAYLGGISYQGRHDILSTDPFYAPFEICNIKNIATNINNSEIISYSNMTIDIETLIKWNPDIIFIDQGGLNLVKNNFITISKLSSLLKSHKEKNIYLLWPFYMYHSNFESLLINAWSIGMIVYPDKFSDVNLRDKASVITKAFVGKDVSEELTRKWGWFRNITNEL